jgi:hypothetical protein
LSSQCLLEDVEQRTNEVDEFISQEGPMKDYTKTDACLLLIQTICKAPRLTLTDKTVREILGDPSKAQYHKLINELTTDVGDRKAILLKQKDSEGNIQFQLNHCDWVHVLEGTQEIHFILKSYKEMGHLFPKIDVDGVSVHAKNIDRRFHYLSQVKVKDSAEGVQTHLEALIKALVGNRRLFIAILNPNMNLMLLPIRVTDPMLDFIINTLTVYDHTS